MPNRLLQPVAALEALHAAGRVHNALLAGEEGVALAAHLNVHLGPGGARLPVVAAGAGEDRVHVLGVYLGFHWLLLAELQYAYLLLAALAVRLELHHPQRLGEDREVAAHADVHARVNASAPLPHDDGAGEHQLAVVALDAQPLGLAVAAVLGASAAFLVCHGYSVSVFFRVRFGFSVSAGVSGSAWRARVRRAGFASSARAGASAVTSGAAAALEARLRRAGFGSAAGASA